MKRDMTLLTANVHQLNSTAKSSTMDIIPTSLLLRCKLVFSEIIAHLANLSFSEGSFLTLFKQASVTPLIKGQSFDKSIPSNYRPISNLNFISKILEHLFLSRFQPQILTSSNFNKYQSAYRPGCSILDNIYSTANAGKLALLISLDLSAAFDTIDHAVLLKRLNCSFGITCHCIFLATVLPDRQNSVCENWYPFISSYHIYSWCSTRLCPWATTSLYLHLNYFHHCSVSSCLPTAVRRRHAAFPRPVTSQSHPKY